MGQGEGAIRRGRRIWVKDGMTDFSLLDKSLHPLWTALVACLALIIMSQIWFSQARNISVPPAPELLHAERVRLDHVQHTREPAGPSGDPCAPWSASIWRNRTIGPALPSASKAQLQVYRSHPHRPSISISQKVWRRLPRYGSKGPMSLRRSWSMASAMAQVFQSIRPSVMRLQLIGKISCAFWAGQLLAWRSCRPTSHFALAAGFGATIWREETWCCLLHPDRRIRI